MRSAPTLNSWTMPFSSVAMIEKLALVRIASSSAPSFRRASAECAWRAASGLEASFRAGWRSPRLWNMDDPGMCAGATYQSGGGPYVRHRTQRGVSGDLLHFRGGDVFG